MSNENPKLTITLTGRWPVRITKAEWPVLASASDSHHDGQVECQANRKASWDLKVRRHSDGRAVVYAIYAHSSTFGSETKPPQCCDARDGDLLAADADLPAAISHVAAVIESRLTRDGAYGRDVFPRLARECIADLPADEI